MRTQNYNQPERNNQNTRGRDPETGGHVIVNISHWRDFFLLICSLFIIWLSHNYYIAITFTKRLRFIAHCVTKSFRYSGDLRALVERLADSLAGRSGSSDSDDIAGVAVSASYGSCCGSSAVGGG